MAFDFGSVSAICHNFFQHPLGIDENAGGMAVNKTFQGIGGLVERALPHEPQVEGGPGPQVIHPEDKRTAPGLASQGGGQAQKKGRRIYYNDIRPRPGKNSCQAVTMKLA